MSSPFKAVLENISRKNLIARINVRNVTITRIGGYNARPYSSRLNLQENPRSQAIRGVWRWWARALVAGAYYEKFTALPSSLEYLDNLVAPVLGSTKQSSKFMLRILVQEAKPGVSNGRARGVARLKLFRPPRGEDKYRREESLGKYLDVRPPGRKDNYQQEESLDKYFDVGRLNFTIELMKSPAINVSQQERNFALFSLVLSLILGGVGSITNRAFGSTQLKITNTTWEFGNLVSQLYTAGNPEEVQSRLHKLVERALGSASDYLDYLTRVDANYLPRNHELRNVKLPPYPVLCEKQIDLDGMPITWFKLTVVGRGFTDSLEALMRIGRASLKASWKSFISAEPNEALSETCQTWILGLPRSSKVKGKRTGYVERVKSDGLKYQDLRRQSAISFSVIPSGDKYYIAVYGFLTSDWLSLLGRDSFIHIDGGHPNGQPVNSQLKLRSPRGLEDLSGLDGNKRIAKTFDAAWEFIKVVILKER